VYHPTVSKSTNAATAEMNDHGVLKYVYKLNRYLVSHCPRERTPLAKEVSIRLPFGINT
jgi:hypothetical protein